MAYFDLLWVVLIHSVQIMLCVEIRVGLWCSGEADWRRMPTGQGIVTAMPLSPKTDLFNIFGEEGIVKKFLQWHIFYLFHSFGEKGHTKTFSLVP